MFSSAGFRKTCSLWSLIVLCACGAPSGSVDKQTIINDVDIFLSAQNCAAAVARIQPLYNSGNTDNQVRLKMASAYGCNATINFFGLTGELASTGLTALTGAGLWKNLSRLFPSTTGSDY